MNFVGDGRNFSALFLAFNRPDDANAQAYDPNAYQQPAEPPPLEPPPGGDYEFPIPGDDDFGTT